MIHVLLLALLAGAPEAPPATRAEQFRRLREEKARQRPAPYRPTFLERQILGFEKAERPSILQAHFKGFWPTFASLASGSRVAPGVRFWDPALAGGPLSLHASAAHSFTGYELFDLQLGLVPHEGTRLPHRSTRGDDVYELGRTLPHGRQRLTLYASARHRDSPRERFFGLGTSSRLDRRTAFRTEDTLLEVVAGWRLAPRAVLTLRGGWLDTKVGPGRSDEVPTTEALFTPATAPGLGTAPDFVRTSLQLLVDARDVPFNPHRGVMLAAAATRFDDEQWGFDRLALDARGYAPLGSVQRVLAVRAYLSRDSAHDGARVPFFLQEPLANSHTLRGYETFLDRGEKIVSLQVEYRWEAAPALELALFVDTGRAFRAQEDIEVGALRTGWGGGLRLKTWNDTLFRFDVARGEGHTRLYVRFGPAF